MNVLVAFGTKYGSTAKVADAVASELIARAPPSRWSTFENGSPPTSIAMTC